MKYSDDIAKAICVSSEMVLLEAEREIDRLKNQRDVYKHAFESITTIIGHLCSIPEDDFMRIVMITADEQTQKINKLIK
jgi:hypothetical protein